MSDRVIRTEKHLTIVEAHPSRPGGNAIVERAYDARWRCREDHAAASERNQADVSTRAKR